MCLYRPELLSINNDIVYKVFIKEELNYKSLFLSSEKEYYLPNILYSARNEKWHIESYPASFHAVRGLTTAKEIIEQISLGQWNVRWGSYIICKVELSGAIYKECWRDWNPVITQQVAGTQMKILEEVC